MSQVRNGHSSVVLDGKIYAMGGNGGGGVLDTVEVYDPQADSWQRVAWMPRGLSHVAAAAMGGKIYVTGGETDQGTGELGLRARPAGRRVDAAVKHGHRSAVSRLGCGGWQALRLWRARRHQLSQHGGGL